MKTNFFSVATFAALAIAAAMPGPVAAQNVPAGPPRCSGPQECEIAWAEAQRSISLLSPMRIRLLTDTRIETYAPMRYGDVGVVATKLPIGNGVYEITVRLECYRSTPCDDLRRSGEMLFYTSIQGAKALSKPLVPATSNQSSTTTPAGLGSGKDAFQAEQALRNSKCQSEPNAKMAANGPGYEIYTAPCTNGDTWVLRCEYGNCRMLR